MFHFSPWLHVPCVSVAEVEVNKLICCSQSTTNLIDCPPPKVKNSHCTSSAQPCIISVSFSVFFLVPFLVILSTPRLPRNEPVLFRDLPMPLPVHACSFGIVHGISTVAQQKQHDKHPHTHTFNESTAIRLLRRGRLPALVGNGSTADRRPPPAPPTLDDRPPTSSRGLSSAELTAHEDDDAENEGARVMGE